MVDLTQSVVAGQDVGTGGRQPGAAVRVAPAERHGQQLRLAPRRLPHRPHLHLWRRCCGGEGPAAPAYMQPHGYCGSRSDHARYGKLHSCMRQDQARSQLLQPSAKSPGHSALSLLESPGLTHRLRVSDCSVSTPPLCDGTAAQEISLPLSGQLSTGLGLAEMRRRQMRGCSAVFTAA